MDFPFVFILLMKEMLHCLGGSIQNLAKNGIKLPYPIGSMYGVFTYIYHKNQPNVGKYTIHGSYGYELMEMFRPIKVVSRKLTARTLENHPDMKRNII